MTKQSTKQASGQPKTPLGTLPSGEACVPTNIKELDKCLGWARKIIKHPEQSSSFELSLALSIMGLRNMLADARIFIGRCKQYEKAKQQAELARSKKNGTKQS